MRKIRRRPGKVSRRPRCERRGGNNKKVDHDIGRRRGRETEGDEARARLRFGIWKDTTVTRGNAIGDNIEEDSVLDGKFVVRMRLI